MAKRALVLAAIYSAGVIAFKLFVWKGGHTFEDFWFKWTHLISVIAIIPFIIIGIRQVRADNDGFIGGKEAAKVGLSIFAISAIVLSIYTYIEFSSSVDTYIAYYKGPRYRAFLESDPRAKEHGYDKIIEFQIEQLKPFRSVTLKLISLFVVSLCTSFISSALMKKDPVQ